MLTKDYRLVKLFIILFFYDSMLLRTFSKGVKMTDVVNATLVPSQAVSRNTNRTYNYVSVRVDDVEIGRVFLQPLVWSVLFDGKTLGR